MKKYLFSVSTNRVGSKVREIVELDDDLTEEEVEELWKEWVWENIEAFFLEGEEE